MSGTVTNGDWTYPVQEAVDGARQLAERTIGVDRVKDHGGSSTGFEFTTLCTTVVQGTNIEGGCLWVMPFNANDKRQERWMRPKTGEDWSDFLQRVVLTAIRCSWS